MIEIKKYAPEEVDELKNDIFNRLEVLKENSDDETIEKIDNLLDSLEDEDNKHQSVRRKSKKLKRDNKKISFYQRFKKALQSNIDIDPGRLMGLTDGIFGMVMTLLVFGIALPELQIANYSDFYNTNPNYWSYHSKFCFNQFILDLPSRIYKDKNFQYSILVD